MINALFGFSKAQLTLTVWTANVSPILSWKEGKNREHNTIHALRHPPKQKNGLKEEDSFHL